MGRIGSVTGGGGGSACLGWHLEVLLFLIGWQWESMMEIDKNG